MIAVLALIYVLVAQQLDDEGLTDNLENKQRTLSRYLETKKLEGPYEVDLQQYKARLQQNRERLLEGDNPNVAESELRKALTDLAQKNGVEITQTIIQNEEKLEGTLYKVSARIVTRCDSEKLVQFLTDIRNNNKFLTVDEFTIQTRSSRTQTSSEIRPTLTVSGYVRIVEAGRTEGGSGASL